MNDDVPGAAGGVPGPAAGTGDTPATETSVPAALNAVTAPGQRGDGGTGQPRPLRLPRRRILVAALITVAIAAAAGLAAVLLPGSAARPVAVPISVKSALPAVGGDVYVAYLGGAQAHAEVYGEIAKAANGEVAQLYAQQFPYKNAPVQAGSLIMHRAGTTASYQFQVTPGLATRYRVGLFASGTASTPFAMSGVATIYVVVSGTTGKSGTCSRPVCRESIQTTNFVPPSALPAEISKPWYPYFAVNLAPAKEPGPPKWLLLRAGNGHVTASRRISAGEFSETVTFSFRIGNDAYDWNWTTCSEDTEAADGIGLPGHHGCGDQRVPASAAYLG